MHVLRTSEGDGHEDISCLLGFQVKQAAQLSPSLTTTSSKVKTGRKRESDGYP